MISKTSSRWTLFPLLTVLFATVGCQDNAQVRALSDQIRAMEASQGQARAELNRLQLQLRSLQSERDKVREEKEKLQLQVDEAKKALEGIQKEFEDYKKQYKLSIRKRAPGMELGQIEVDGRQFEGVKIRELTESSLTFMHLSGTMSVPLAQLKPELQRQLGYEEGVKVMAGITRKTGLAAGGVARDQQLAELEAKITDGNKQLAKMRGQLQELEARIRTAEVNGVNATAERQSAAALNININELEVAVRNWVPQRDQIRFQMREQQVR
jgi:chromosome segregation ATPase